MYRILVIILGLTMLTILSVQAKASVNNCQYNQYSKESHNCYPSATPTVGVTVTPTEVPSVTPELTVTPTATPSVTQTPSNTSGSDGLSDGRHEPTGDGLNDGLGCASHPCVPEGAPNTGRAL